MRKTKTFAGLMLAALLTSCGQMGPLYLPDTNGNVITRPIPEPTQPPPTPPQR
jgi:predicted small lipoprotein YifL